MNCHIPEHEKCEYLTKTHIRLNVSSSVNNTHEEKFCCTAACCKYHYEKFTWIMKSAKINVCPVRKRYEWIPSPCKLSHKSDFLPPSLREIALMLFEGLRSTWRKTSSSTHTDLAERGLPTLFLLALMDPLSRSGLRNPLEILPIWHFSVGKYFPV